MRVTNTMMTNTMLLNINRNVRALDTLYNQISTAKKIQVPSDDPITASRALKFRTNVAETLQYQRNVSQGMSWMNVTESAYNNVIDMVKTIKDRCGEAATGTLEGADKKTVAAQIRQVVLQLGQEMNVSYAGRYVFSGFRTDQPPILTRAEPDLGYTGITQFFGRQDIEITKSYQKLPTGTPPGTDEPIVHDVNIIKLPYKNAVNVTAAGYTVNAAGVGDPAAYDVSLLADDEINYITETGEMVMNDAAAAAFGERVAVVYDKTGFAAGDLNPLVYFPCTDSGGVSYNMDNQNIAYEFGVNTAVNVNSLARNAYTDKMYADLTALCDMLERAGVSDEASLAAKYRAMGYGGEELARLVRDQLTGEKANLQAVLHDRFNNMLYLAGNYMS
ncbi:MAG: hypothetical protein FWC55_08765 [Firmicutes bacterium]|nr:hypothetical protein [Bacillota bacterium]